jgi:hypothetical protein
MRGRTVPLACIALLIGFGALRASIAWSELPDVMARHFGAAGRPDGWQSKAAFFGSFGGISAFTLWVLLLIGQLLRFVPVSAINIPHREYWLTLERRAEAMARLTSSMDWLAVSVAAVLVATLDLVIQANVARQPLDNALMAMTLVAFFVFLIGWLIHLWRRFKPA